MKIVIRWKMKLGLNNNDNNKVKMGQSTYYHNLTKNWFNENDYRDAVENSDVGDLIKMSFRGNALIIDLLNEDLKIEIKGEHDWARKQFIDYFKEFHEVEFFKTKAK